MNDEQCTVLVNVTQEDIDAGVAQDGEWCPLAIALRRHGIEADVSHGDFEGWDTIDGEEVLGSLSRSAERFVRRFDTGKPVSPRRFRLKLRTPLSASR